MTRFRKGWRHGRSAGLVMLTLLISIACVPRWAMATPTFGSGVTFLFPDLFSGTLFLDVGVTGGTTDTVLGPSGITGVVANPSRNDLAPIKLLPQGGVFTGFWSNEPVLPNPLTPTNFNAGSSPPTFYTLVATNAAGETASINTPLYVGYPVDLAAPSRVALGRDRSGNLVVSWDREFFTDVSCGCVKEVSQYQVRIIRGGVTIATLTLDNTQVGSSPSRASATLTPPQSHLNQGDVATLRIGAVVVDPAGNITARSNTLTDFTFDTGGASQNLPLLPAIAGSGHFVFSNVPGGLWFDPPSASGFHFVMDTVGSVFTEILNFPTGFGSPFIVSSDGVVLGSFLPGNSFVFPGGGVSEFSVSGINPSADSTNPNGFPIQLEFNTPFASFEMDAISSVPAPETLLLLAAGAAIFALRRTHTWRRNTLRLVICGFVSATLVVIAQRAEASSLTAATQVDFSGMRLTQEIVNTGNPATSDKIGPFLSNSFVDVGGEAFASATYGTLKAFDTIDVSVDVTPPATISVGGAVDSSALFFDSFTVNGPSFVSVSASLLGGIDGTGDATLSIQLRNLLIGTFECVIHEVGSCTTPMVPAGSMQLTANLGVRAIIPGGFYGAGEYISTAAYQHTGLITTIHGFDAAGDELNTFTVTADSGFAYPTGPLATVPEPATILLMGMGGTAVLGWRRRRADARAYLRSSHPE
jgi:PEP-CTERM motif